MTRLSVKRIFVLLLLCCSAVLAADSRINGTVLDSKGAAIAKAHVIIRADASGKRDPMKSPTGEIATDKQGHFSAPVSAGFYDVCVMADAFSPQCQKLFVERESVAPRIILKADPEVMKRLGDQFLSMRQDFCRSDPEAGDNPKAFRRPQMLTMGLFNSLVYCHSED